MAFKTFDAYDAPNRRVICVQASDPVSTASHKTHSDQVAWAAMLNALKAATMVSVLALSVADSDLSGGECVLDFHPQQRTALLGQGGCLPCLAAFCAAFTIHAASANSS